MKPKLTVLAGLTFATVLGGCASGGGGGGGTGSINDALGAIFLPVLCGLVGNRSDEACQQYGAAAQASSGAADSADSSTSTMSPIVSGANTAPPGTFTSLWEGDRTALVGLATGVNYAAQFQSVGDATYSAANLQDFSNLKFSDGSLSSVGHPGLDVFTTRDNAMSSVTFGSSDTSYGLIANPLDLGWDYQSFGVWRTSNAAGNWINAISVAEKGAVSAAPLSGAATFTGKLGGLYISPAGQGLMAASDLSVNANFSARSLSFASTNTVTTIRQASPTAAPHLNLNGTLTYSPGTSAFTGTLTSAGGTMSGTSNGQFYGPIAQELGGVFSIKSPSTVETFTGAYGAKR